MTLLVRGFDIVVVPFPNGESPGTVKPRPALVISNETHHRTGQVIVAMITSSETAWPGDIDIANWLEVGLPKPSKVRTAKLATFDLQLVQKRLGTIDQEAKVAVKSCLREFIEF